jgi:large-conductance mechanosensitive channel
VTGKNMNKSLYIACIIFILNCVVQSYAFAQATISIDNQSVVFCPAKPAQKMPPTFTEKECQQGLLLDIDPQNVELWLKANLTVTDAYLKRKQPSAIFVFAKMSSEVFLNGEQLGSNGTPNYLKEEEFSGDMDAKFYIPPRLLKRGANEVIIHASSHHGFLTLSRPIHFIGISEYGQTSEFFKRDLLILLSLLGAMLLGCTYLITLVFSAEDKETPVLILLMLAAASGQLFTEVSRVIFNYSYPLHDIRLIAIVVLSLIFGFSLLLFTLKKFARAQRNYWLMLVVPLTILLSFMTPGFDGKSVIAILVPALFSVVISGLSCWKIRSRESISYFVAYNVFCLTIVFTFGKFNSMYFYYIVTGMMTFLVIKMVHQSVKDKKQRKEEEQQLLKLQLKVDQLAQQKLPTTLQLSSAGKIEIIPVNDVAYCKAAGDYVEIFLTNQSQSLFSGTLKSIEEKLPSTFLKVHRSYIVNLDEVMSVTSSKNGATSSGILALKNGDEIPVSRRILPHVRGVIKGSVALA